MTKKPFKDAGRRAWIYAERIFKSKDFKADAAKYRDAFGIPEQGFTEHADISQWYAILYHNSVEQVPPEKVPTLRNIKRRLQDYGEVPFEDLNVFNSSPDIYILDAWFKMEDIRHKYGIPPRWRSALLKILLTNSIDGIGLPVGVAVTKRFNGLFYYEELMVIVDKFTRKKDYDEAWKVIKEMQKDLFANETKWIKTSPSYKKYKKAADLRKQGKTYTQIGDELGITSGEAKIYETRYRNRIGINSKRTRYL